MRHCRNLQKDYTNKQCLCILASQPLPVRPPCKDFPHLSSPGAVRFHPHLLRLLNPWCAPPPACITHGGATATAGYRWSARRVSRSSPGWTGLRPDVSRATLSHRPSPWGRSSLPPEILPGISPWIPVGISPPVLRRIPPPSPACGSGATWRGRRGPASPPASRCWTPNCPAAAGRPARLPNCSPSMKA